MTPCLIININISLKARDNILILIQATILKKECKNQLIKSEDFILPLNQEHYFIQLANKEMEQLLIGKDVLFPREMLEYIDRNTGALLKNESDDKNVLIPKEPLESKNYGKPISKYSMFGWMYGKK